MKRESSMWVEAVPVDETRAEGAGEKVLRVRGYAILWNYPSERMGRVVETIDSGSLDHMDLAELDVRMLAEHKDKPLARMSNSTLRVSKDTRGLMIEADLDARRSDSRDLYYAVERGDITQMSFGFSIDKNGEELTESPDGTIRAHVTRIKELYEVSAVGLPAYRDTSIEAVGACEDCGEADCSCGANDDEDAVEDRSWELDLVRVRIDMERGV